MQGHAAADLPRDRRLWLGGGMAGLAAFLALGLWTPGEAVPTLCLLRRTTGIDCPGCGMVRAATYLARGDVAGAAALHPLAPLFAAEALLLWFGWGLFLALGRKPHRRWLPFLVLANCLLLLAAWLPRLPALLSRAP